MLKKVTMSDIALAAGVSQSTVSLVLNGSQSVKIAESTQQKVFAAAQALGYVNKNVPHAKGRPKKLALIVNELIANDPFIDAINGAKEEAWGRDYILAIFSYSHDPLLAKKIEAEINSGDYSGIIYASSMTRELGKLRVSSTLPTVLLNCSQNNQDHFPSILPADMVGAYKAIMHLTEQGYRRIAILAGETWMLAAQQRIEGYRQALVDADIIPNDKYILEANWSLQEAYTQTLALLAMTPRPEAIFCSSDHMAMGCYQAITEQGLAIPGDIAVVGYDNQKIAQESFPALTSVELPYEEMGKIAVETLMDVMEQQPLLTKKRKIEGDLIERASSIRIKQAE